MNKIFYIKDAQDNKLLPFQFYNLFGFVTLPTIGKVPFIKKWNHISKTISPSNLNHNIAVLTGKVSGISVLDLDGDIDLFKKLFGEIDTPTVKTNKGFHLYFKYDPEIKSSIKLNGTGLKNGKINWDFRNGNLVSLPPSKINDFTYKWVKGKTLNDCSIKSIPNSLKKMLIERKV
jgi:hypothetical protein